MPLTDADRRRYSRHLLLPELGDAGQEALKNARVLVVGAGGLGCPVLQYLTAAGIGTLGVIDGDTVAESNLQRQILFGPADVGYLKATVAVARLSAQNPLITLRAHTHWLTADTVLDTLADYDLVVDGSDNFATRYLVSDACVVLGKPLVSGAIHRFEGQVTVLNLGDGPTYRCLYPDPGDLPGCAEAGVLGVLPGVVGCLMASEVIKLCTGIGTVLSGQLLVVDALTLQFRQFGFEADPANKNRSQLPDALPGCEPTLPELTYATLQYRLKTEPDLLLVDVREPAERIVASLGGQSIPLARLLADPGLVPADRPVVVYCQSGQRSRKAVAFLLAHGYERVASLRGGMQGR
ncbi:molybdopterin-synthase adenylyltransferase MoeB [Spirosoma luteolum]